MVLDGSVEHDRETVGREYVLVGVEVDEGEVKLGDRIADVTIMDLDDNLVLMGIPTDLTSDQKKALRGVIAKTSRRVLVVEGKVGERWTAVRLVPKEKYDADFEEVKP